MKIIDAWVQPWPADAVAKMPQPGSKGWLLDKLGFGISNEEAFRDLTRLHESPQMALDDMDRRILAVLAQAPGTPVGLKTLAVATGEEDTTIEDVYEPYLIQHGYLKRTPRGRVATVRAYEHLGRARRNPGLF